MKILKSIVRQKTSNRIFTLNPLNSALPFGANGSTMLKQIIFNIKSLYLLTEKSSITY